MAIIVGVITSVLVIGWTLQFLNRNNRSVQEARYDVGAGRRRRARRRETGLDGASYRVARAGGLRGDPRRHLPGGRHGRTCAIGCRRGSAPTKAPAPQATLMSLVIKGILTQKLPVGLRPARRLHVDPDGDHRRARPGLRGGHVPARSRARRRSSSAASRGGSWTGGGARRRSPTPGPGVLYSSGLVAGGSIMGLAVVVPERARAFWSASPRPLAFGHEALPPLVGLPGLPRGRLPDLPDRPRERGLEGAPPTMKIAFIGTPRRREDHALLRPRLGPEAPGRERRHREGGRAALAAADQPADVRSTPRPGS